MRRQHECATFLQVEGVVGVMQQEGRESSTCGRRWSGPRASMLWCRRLTLLDIFVFSGFADNQICSSHRSLPAALEGLIRATMGIRVKRSTIESWNYGQALEDYDDDEVVE